MHINNEIYYFVNKFNKKEIKKLQKNITVIYRNYNNPYTEKDIKEYSKYCKSLNIKFFLANDIKLVNKLNLDGAYIPSFNKNLNCNILRNKNISIIGSAHNLREINIKNKQNVDKIVISPVFKDTEKNKKLSISQFNNLTINNHKKKYIALGGIDRFNLQKIKMLNCIGFASISYIRDNL